MLQEQENEILEYAYSIKIDVDRWQIFNYRLFKFTSRTIFHRSSNEFLLNTITIKFISNWDTI